MATGLAGRAPDEQPGAAGADAAPLDRPALRAAGPVRLVRLVAGAGAVAALRLKPGTVKSRLHRAFQALERSLGHLR